MTNTTKVYNLIKKGFKNPKRKVGVNYWRFIFNAVGENTGAEKSFFIELEYINPSLSPSAPRLGFKPRVKISEADLQYVLAGTNSAKTLETEAIIQPSYCSVRVGMVGKESKQICEYHGLKSCSIKNNPFEITIGNSVFAENKLSGYVSLSEQDAKDHPEFLCNGGSAEWNIDYSLETIFMEGFKSSKAHWFPCGCLAKFSGNILFDGTNYLIDAKRSYGYCDRYLGSVFPEKWFHLSSSNLTSNISGKLLFDSNFSVQGVFNDRISFLGTFEGQPLVFTADSSKSKYSCVWDCTQAPEGSEYENKLHWSVSIHNKIYVIDIDVYFDLKELHDRKLELPQGKRKIMDLLEGFCGTGEIKLYKKNKKTLEQLEFAKIEKAVCEFGEIEEGGI